MHRARRYSGTFFARRNSNIVKEYFWNLYREDSPKVGIRYVGVKLELKIDSNFFLAIDFNGRLHLQFYRIFAFSLGPLT